jgi:hypothetical protein
VALFFFPLLNGTRSQLVISSAGGPFLASNPGSFLPSVEGSPGRAASSLVADARKALAQRLDTAVFAKSPAKGTTGSMKPDRGVALRDVEGARDLIEISLLDVYPSQHVGVGLWQRPDESKSASARLVCNGR